MKATVKDILSFVSEFTSDDIQVKSFTKTYVYLSVPGNLTKYFVKCMRYYFKEILGKCGVPVCTLVDNNVLKVKVIYG